jgi:hypothetical protein
MRRLVAFSLNVVAPKALMSVPPAQGNFTGFFETQPAPALGARREAGRGDARGH